MKLTKRALPLAAALGVAALSAACLPTHPIPQSPDQWEASSAFRYDCGARTTSPDLNAAAQVNVVSPGISDAQMADITDAVANVRTWTGIGFYLTVTSHDHIPGAINIYKRAGNGLSSYALDNTGGRRHGGDIMLYPGSNQLVNRVPLSTPNVGFQKMMVQRLLNEVGLNDVGGPGSQDELMSGIFNPSSGYGDGTLSGALQLGCYPPGWQQNVFNLVFPGRGQVTGPASPVAR